MLRLPHPEMASLLDRIRQNVIMSRQSEVLGTELTYAIFNPKSETPDLAFYDEEGRIYVPEYLVAFDERYADLLALHEHIEIRHKLAGRSHAYAHRHALVEELLAARQIFDETVVWKDYVQWRIRLYPTWKVPDPDQIIDQFVRLIAEDKPRKGKLLQVIKEHRL